MSTLKMTGVTDPGKLRAENEDNIATSPALGLAVLADGMGGHQAGEVASRMAVDVVNRHFQEVLGRNPNRGGNGKAFEQRAVTKAIELANAAIYEMAHQRKECAGMGSTVVVAAFYDDKICIGHVGDSRLYRLRGGKLEQLTQDHSVIEELVARGLLSREEARQTIGKNLVTRALGIDPFVAADVTELPREANDLYLLCSDGLNDVVPDPDIESLLSAGSQEELWPLAQRLVAIANERGGPDNISVILVRPGERVEREIPPAPGPSPEEEFR